MKTRQDYLNLLKETVNYYTKEKNKRAVSEDEDCFYYTNGNMCAVGRCLIKPQGKDKTLKLTEKGYSSVKYLLLHFKETIFKKEYRGFDLRMWEELQNLHDTTFYWSGFELSTAGKGKVKEIKSYINDKFRA